MVTKEYVHYGSSEFLLSRFRRIQNRPLFPKPNGGLWASRSDYPLSWKKWCKKENYNTWNLKESFSFHLDEKTRILTITSAEQLLSLPRCSFEKIKVKISKNWEFFLRGFWGDKQIKVLSWFWKNFTGLWCDRSYYIIRQSFGWTFVWMGLRFFACTKSICNNNQKKQRLTYNKTLYEKIQRLIFFDFFTILWYN